MELEELRLSDQGREWLDDFYRFSVEAWGLDLYEEPHRRMCDIIEDSELDNGKPYAMLVVPRGFYKTSIVCAAAVWKQLRQLFLHRNPYHRIVLCSATLPLSETSLRRIEGQLRYNKKLKDNYGSLWVYNMQKGLSSRHKDGLFLAPRLRIGEIAGVAEPSFWVGSIRRISTGFHADEAIVDDLNNKDNTATAVQREKVKEYWRLLFPILGNNDRSGRTAKITMNATPWHDDDVRGMILRYENEQQETNPKYESKWNILHHSAYNEDGTAWWPEKYPVEVLEQLKSDIQMTYSQFAANYLCDPIGNKGFVAEEKIIWKSRYEFPRYPKHFRATVDPNMHFEARAIGCYAAIAVAGYDQFANLYVHDLRGSREWTSAQLIDQLFQLNEDWPGIEIMVEDIHMAHFAHAIALEEANRSDIKGERVHLRIRWTNTQTESKYEKWSKMQPRFEQGKVIFAQEIDPKLRVEVREELVRGEAARFHDFLDALAMHEIGVRPKYDRNMRPPDPPKKNAPNISMNFEGPRLVDFYPDLKKIYQ